MRFHTVSVGIGPHANRGKQITKLPNFVSMAVRTRYPPEAHSTVSSLDLRNRELFSERYQQSNVWLPIWVQNRRDDL